MTLVVVSGCDGAGKSTILNLLCQRNNSYQKAHWSDFVEYLGFQKAASDLIQEMHPETRALFLLLLNSGLSEHMIEPMRREGKVVVCESYYLKFLAKERMYGIARPDLIERLTALPPPDLVVNISIDPNIAFLRLAQRVSKYEIISGSDTREGFLQLQENIQREIIRISSEFNVPVLTIDGTYAPAENSAIIDAWIQNHLSDPIGKRN